MERICVGWSMSEQLEYTWRSEVYFLEIACKHKNKKDLLISRESLPWMETMSIPELMPDVNEVEHCLLSEVE